MHPLALPGNLLLVLVQAFGLHPLHYQVEEVDKLLVAVGVDANTQVAMVRLSWSSLTLTSYFLWTI